MFHVLKCVQFSFDMFVAYLYHACFACGESQVCDHMRFDVRTASMNVGVQLICALRDASTPAHCLHLCWSASLLSFVAVVVFAVICRFRFAHVCTLCMLRSSEMHVVIMDAPFFGISSMFSNKVTLCPMHL